MGTLLRCTELPSDGIYHCFRTMACRRAQIGPVTQRLQGWYRPRHLFPNPVRNLGLALRVHRPPFGPNRPFHRIAHHNLADSSALFRGRDIQDQSMCALDICRRRMKYLARCRHSRDHFDCLHQSMRLSHILASGMRLTRINRAPPASHLCSTPAF